MTKPAADTSESQASIDPDGTTSALPSPAGGAIESIEDSTSDDRPRRRRRKKRSAFRRFSHSLRSFAVSTLVLACISTVGLFCFSFLGRYLFLAELVGNFRFQITVMLIAAGFAAIVIGRRQLAALVIATAVLSSVGFLSIYLPPNNPPAGPEKIKIMSYNVLVSNWEVYEVVEQIKKHDPDVINILEYARNWHLMLECLTEKYPYQVKIPRWHGFGLAIFSKYPLSETTIHQLTNSKTDNPFVVTSVTVGDQTIRLASIHVLSPTNRTRLKHRNFQFLEAAQLLGANQSPTVVMGDFNNTPWSPFLRDFVEKTGYRDSRQGFGYHATWPADMWWARIPIDHAFVSKDIHVHSRMVGDASDSDHLPIIFEISTAK